jgi:hypothetical protein
MNRLSKFDLITRGLIAGDAAVSTAAGTKLLGELIDRYRKKKYESLTGRQ